MITTLSRREQQRGFTLVFTLIILVVMVLTAQAMMIMMRGGSTSAGNIAFRQAAVRVADVAAEDAYTWVNSITALGTGLENPAPAIPGYYAKFNEVNPACSSSGTFSPKDYDFTNSNCAMAHTGSIVNRDPANVVEVSNYRLYYVVHRMASGTGACTGGAGCSGPLVISVCRPPFSLDPSSPDYCKAGITSTRVYYRITVKVVGARHNSRFIQTFVY